MHVQAANEVIKMETIRQSALHTAKFIAASRRSSVWVCGVVHWGIVVVGGSSLSGDRRRAPANCERSILRKRSHTLAAGEARTQLPHTVRGWSQSSAWKH